MALDLAELKTAMTDAGFAPSAGTNWLPSDVPQYLQYVFLNFNMTPETAMVGLQYPGALPEGFPGKEAPTPPVRTLISIALTGTATAAVGATSQLTATGTYNVAPLTEDVTSSATWVSSVPGNATVAAGLVTGVAAGSTNITAAVGAVTSAPTAFTVTAARAVTSVTISGPATVEEGATINLTATANYNIAPLTEDVTATATWVSAATGVATVAAGVVTGVAEGDANITAAFGGQTSAAHGVTVTAAV